MKSLIKFLAEAHRGVQGFVFDPAGMPIERASIKIKGRDVGFQTTKYGEFWRILLPRLLQSGGECPARITNHIISYV